MEINFNRNSGNFNVSGFGMVDTAGQTSKSEDLQTFKHLTIQTSTATPEEIAAAEIPEAALSRDDALGNLVNGAFNLPPPPMPDFSRL